MPRKGNPLDNLPVNDKPTAASPDAQLEVSVAKQTMQNLRDVEKTIVETAEPLPKYPLLEQKPPPLSMADPVGRGFHPVLHEVLVDNRPAHAFHEQPPPKPPELIAAAALLVTHMKSLASEWKLRLEAMQSERNLSEDQMCFALMAYTLDSGNYLIIPTDHPYFAEKFQPTGSSFNCVICDVVESRRYPGQPPLCSNKCANKFYEMADSDRQELLDAAV